MPATTSSICAHVRAASRPPLTISVDLPSEMKRLKLLEEENARLKKLVADLSLDKAMLQDVVKRKL